MFAYVSHSLCIVYVTAKFTPDLFFSLFPSFSVFLSLLSVKRTPLNIYPIISRGVLSAFAAFAARTPAASPIGTALPVTR